MMVGRWVSFWDCLFLGAMLNFRGVSYITNGSPSSESRQSFWVFHFSSEPCWNFGRVYFKQRWSSFSILCLNILGCSFSPFSFLRRSRPAFSTGDIGQSRRRFIPSSIAVDPSWMSYPRSVPWAVMMVSWTSFHPLHPSIAWGRENRRCFKYGEIAHARTSSYSLFMWFYR